MPRSQFQLSRRPSTGGRRALTVASALVVALATTGPVFAEEANTSPTAVDRLKAEADLVTAEKELTEAQTAAVKARLDALGLPLAQGKTTLGEGAGAMEASMLSAAAMNQAAEAIAAEGIDGPVIVIASSEKLDFSLPVSLTTQMAVVTEDARALAKAACEPAEIAIKPKPKPKPQEGWSGIMPKTFVPPGLFSTVGAAISLLKIDTKISAVAVANPTETAIVAAVAGRVGGYALSEAVLPSNFATSSVGLAWKDLRLARSELVDCHSRLIRAEETDLAAKVATSVGHVDTFIQAISKPEAGGSLIVRAAILEKAIPANAKVLRVTAERTGGTLIQRTSILTAFGATGVSLTGGLVVSYRLTDPVTGKISKSGLLVCRTAHTRLSDVHKGKVGPGGCSKLLKSGS